jgi:hypothetical protein
MCVSPRESNWLFVGARRVLTDRHDEFAGGLTAI